MATVLGYRPPEEEVPWFGEGGTIPTVLGEVGSDLRSFFIDPMMPMIEGMKPRSPEEAEMFFRENYPELGSDLGYDRGVQPERRPSGYWQGSPNHGRGLNALQQDALMGVMGASEFTPLGMLGGTVLKYGRKPLGEALKKFPTRKYRGKEVFRGSPQDLSVTKAKMPAQLGKMQSMAEEGVPAWDWYFSGGRAFGDWWHPRNVGFAIDNTALASPMTGVDLNSKYGANLMNQWALGKQPHAGLFPNSLREKAGPLWSGDKTIWDVGESLKIPTFATNTRHGAGLPVSKEDMLRATMDRWMGKAGRITQDSITKNQFEYLQAMTQDVASALKILPHQAQAGVWTSIKARWEAVAPTVHRDYVKNFQHKMRKSEQYNPNTNEITEVWQIRPEFAREFHDKIFRKAVKHDLPDSALDEAGRSFDYFFNKMAKEYPYHDFGTVSKLIDPKTGRIGKWDVHGIPHRVDKKAGKVELLMPELSGRVDPSAQKQMEIARAVVDKDINALKKLGAYERFIQNKPLFAP